MNILQWSQALAVVILSIFAISFIVMAIQGGINNYTQVPLGDMWDGYIEFYRRIKEGYQEVWWEQHNEHRIVLSRLLFWADLEIFKGSCILLIVTNYIFCITTSLVLISALRHGFKYRNNNLLFICYAFFIIAFSFSWIQVENFIWGFQGQFFLAFLIPLTAFYYLYKSSLNKRDVKFFLISCVAGIASAGTMVNGVLALPLMTIMSLILKTNQMKKACLFGISALVICLYSRDFQSIAYHASPINTILNHPFEFLEYFLLYLGGPFCVLTGGSEPIGELAAIFMVGSFCYFVYKNLNSISVQWVLLTFIFLVQLTVLATAGGRLGITSSLSSRYMTPALMAWSALFIIYALNLRRDYNLTPFLILTLCLLLPCQQRALIQNSGNIFEQKISALALQMRIKDREQIDLAYANMERALSVSQFPISNHLCIFGTTEFKELGQSMGRIVHGLTTKTALGCMDEISPVEEDPVYIKVGGWIYEPGAEQVPSLVYILDQDQKIVGLALTGKNRRDLKGAIPAAEKYAGFAGYMLAKEIDKPVTLLGKNPDCQLNLFTSLK